MAWYHAGTVAVTNGSPTVAGSGTAWNANVVAGAAFIGPDGRSYEIAGVVSDTALSLATPYQGTSASGQVYQVQPTQSFAADLALSAAALINSFAAVRDGVGAGINPDGTQSQPAFRFSADQDTGIFRAGTNVLGITTAGSERVRVNAAGQMGVGTAAPGNQIDVRAPTFLVANFQCTDTTGAYSTDVYWVNSNNASYGAIKRMPDGNMVYLQPGTFAHLFYTTNALRFVVESGGVVRAGADNTQSLGNGGFCWSQLFAGTATIATSDGREKTWRGGLSPAELVAARAITGRIGAFQFNDAIAEKGADGARIHFGVIAQDVCSDMETAGLDPARYAFICHDAWDAAPAVAGTPARAAVHDKEGVLLSPAQEAMPGSPARVAGDRYGIRYEELSMFLIAAQEQRLSALEAAA